MSWYNTYSESARRFEQLIDNKPTLEQLLDYPEFIEILKSYNPKLLDYISASTEIPKQIVRYLTQVPAESDSESRKYRLPMLTLMTLQTNTACVVNSFFKFEPNSQKPYFIYSFYEFLQSGKQLLPLLCGYFSQMNVILWNNRYKETIDLVYDHRQPLFLLANHTYNRSVVNTIMLYLNLDLTRNSTQLPERTQIKLQILKNLYEQIRAEFQLVKKQGKNESSQIVVENICDILIQIVQKYYLIADGKTMLELINSQQNIDLVLQILMSGGELSLSVIGLVLWLMRYYCLSSFNQEDKINLQHSKKNQERLEAQPFIKKITELIPFVAEEIFNCHIFTLYYSRLLDVFISCLELSSKKVGEAIRNSKFLQNLIALLFKYPNLSIVHKQVQRAFFAIFCSQRKMCQQYRKYLFCTAGIIEMTAGQGLERIDKLGQVSSRLGWFGYLMKIVKVYSKIQTDDQQINNAIIKRSELWQRFSTTLMRPFDAVSFKELGSYQGMAEKSAVEYTVRSVSGVFSTTPPVSKKFIQQLIKEQSMQQFLTTIPQKPQETKAVNLAEDSLFMIQDFQKVTENLQNKPPQVIAAANSASPQIKIKYQGSTPQPLQKVQSESSLPSNHQEIVIVKQHVVVEENKKQQTNSTSFQQFLNNRKQEIGQELTIQRKNSSEKRLSANKSRVTSPSPKKKRWDDGGNEPQSEDKPNSKLAAPVKPAQSEQKKQKISLTTPSIRPPLIPTQKTYAIQQARKQEQRVFQIVTNTYQKSAQNLDSQQLIVNSSINDLNPKQLNKSLEQSRTMSSSHLVINKGEIETRMTKSAVNFNELKNVQFLKTRVEQAQKKQFRKVVVKDKLLLQYLGIKY